MTYFWKIAKLQRVKRNLWFHFSVARACKQVLGEPVVATTASAAAVAPGVVRGGAGGGLRCS